jgi:outer membrane protein TolC
MVRRLILFLLLFTSAIAAFSQVRTLDDYLRMGITGNPVLNDLAGQVMSNRIDSGIIHAGRLPQVNLNGTFSYAPVIKGYGYSEAITNGGNFLTLLAVSQPLFNGKTILAQYNRIGLLNNSVLNSRGLAERDLKKSITEKYLDACALGVDIAMDQSLAVQGRAQERLLGDLVSNGLYRQTDLMSFMLELQSLELHLNDLQTQYGLALSDLNQLCGIRDTSTVTLELPDLRPVIPVQRPGALFYQRFEIDSLRIRNDLSLLDRNYKPRISWYTDAGIVNNVPSDLYRNLGMSFGLAFSLPVFDGHQRKLNADKLAVTEHSRIIYRDFFDNQYNQQVQQLVVSLNRTRELIPRLEKHLQLAESIVSQDKVLLNSGAIPVTEYLIAVKNVISIRSDLNRTRIRILRIINEINYWKE